MTEKKKWIEKHGIILIFSKRPMRTQSQKSKKRSNLNKIDRPSNEMSRSSDPILTSE